MIKKFYSKCQSPPVLYKSFTMGSDLMKVTYRANRSFHGKPWHDFLSCSVIDEGGVVHKYAALALTFVSLGQNKMYVLVEWYVIGC